MCELSCCSWCTAKTKFTVILAWIQIFVYTILSSIVISAIFVVMLTDEINLAKILSTYAAMFGAVPVTLITELLKAVSLVPNNKEISATEDELRVSTLAICLAVLVFLLPAIVTGIYLLKGTLQETPCVRTWSVLAVLFFAFSIMEVVAGGYINGILSMIIYAIAIWIVHKEHRKSHECQNRII